MNLWVPKVGSKDKATLEHHYDPKKSSSSSSTSETFEITYGTGSTKGNYYSDYATFISGTANNLLFGAANETNFDVPGADGIMGLARDYSKYMYSAIWTLNTKGYIPNKNKYVKLSWSAIMLDAINNMDVFSSKQQTNIENLYSKIMML